MTLEQIIEAAYHCAWSNDEVHAAIAEAGIDQVSDESVANLLGQYHISIEAQL